MITKSYGKTKFTFIRNWQIFFQSDVISEINEFLTDV